MKKMVFSAIAMVAFTVSGFAQTSGNPITSNSCIQEGFKAADIAVGEGKKGGEIADAADKAKKDCEEKKKSESGTSQTLTLLRF